MMRTTTWMVVLAVAAVVATAALAGSPPTDVTNAHWVGDELCMECHDDMTLPFGQIHARIESFEVRGRTVGCEGCHGPGSEHVDEGDADLIRTFASGGVGDDACLECHQYKGMQQWHASTHNAVDVGCSNCHSIHVEPTQAVDVPGRLLPGPTTLGLDRSSPYWSCGECHADSVAQFELPYRHPLREGKMDCGSCHDVHGAGEAMLLGRHRRNEACYTCHQNTEGPFVFEHAPVQEDCSVCHTPHGSVVPAMLTANQPALCLQCHDFHFHAGYEASQLDEVDVGGLEKENPWGPQGFNMAFTTNCTQCHSEIHGSDLPSQSVPGMGRGLAR